MTQFMKSLEPDCFDDTIAGISLYRPGPMDSIPTYIRNKKNPSGVTYLDPHLEPILKVTYGCLVYQEQVMQIVRDLAGYSYGRSDLVRRAMSKKKADVMLKEEQYFVYGRPAEDGQAAVKGCIANGIPEDSRIKTDGRFLNQEKLAPHIEQIKKLNDIATKRGETLAQMALKWVVKDNDVTSVLVGASKPQQILENLKVMEGTGFSEEELRMIDEVVGV